MDKEKVSEMVLSLMGQVKEMFLADGLIAPVALLFGEKVEVAAVALKFEGPATKDSVRAKLFELIKSQDVDFYFTVFDSWITAVQIKDLKDKKIDVSKLDREGLANLAEKKSALIITFYARGIEMVAMQSYNKVDGKIIFEGCEVVETPKASFSRWNYWTMRVDKHLN